MEELSGKGVAVLPVLIEDCELPSLLKDRVYADFRRDFNAGLQKLRALFEQEGESAANVAQEVAINAAPCSQKLSGITLADLRRHNNTRIDPCQVRVERPSSAPTRGHGSCPLRLCDEIPPYRKSPI